MDWMSNATSARRSHSSGEQAQSKRDPEDEIRYCERCGISFLWTIEEQKAAQNDRSAANPSVRAPDLCAGCRVLLPSPNRVRGMVKWYNIRKRYGFIVRQGEPEIFVPAAALQGPRFLQTGDLVEFSLGQNQEGPIAQEVTLLQRSDAL
jgi:CspA family cold shock protein